MNTGESMVLLQKVRAAVASGSTPIRVLERVRQLIETKRCFCGRGWMRGGNRQGSALCKRCYTEDGI